MNKSNIICITRLKSAVPWTHSVLFKSEMNQRSIQSIPDLSAPFWMATNWDIHHSFKNPWRLYIYIYMFSSICFRKLHWYHTIQYLHIKKKQVFSPSRCLYRHFGEAIHLFCLQAADSWDPDQAAGLLPWCTWQPYDGGNPGTVVSFKLVLMDVHFIINPFHHLSTRWSNSFAGAIPTSDIHPFSLNFAVRLCLTAPMKQPEYKYPSDR